MREPLKDKTRLEHILEAIDRLEKYASSLSREELEADVLRYYGIVKNIEIIGEAANMLTPLAWAFTRLSNKGYPQCLR